MSIEDIHAGVLIRLDDEGPSVYRGSFTRSAEGIRFKHWNTVAWITLKPETGEMSKYYGQYWKDVNKESETLFVLIELDIPNPHVV